MLFVESRLKVMNEISYEFPGYAEEIIKILIDCDWFIHPFELQNEYDIYNPKGYLSNSEFENVEYTIFLDLNIYQYVLSAFKKQNKNQLHRDAMALMVFGKITNLVFDPTLAVYEKLNYLEQCPDELIDDLMLFRKIDNSEIEGLAKFALGLENTIPLGNICPINKENLKSELTKHKRLMKWDTFYLFVLKIVQLYYFDKSSNEEKIIKFLKWSFSDFIYSLVAISFAIKLFGNSTLPKLMKYKPGFSVTKKKNTIVNMTWDLFLLDKFFENWVKKEPKKEFIYASNDRLLKKVLEIAISIQKNEFFNNFEKQLSPKLIKELSDIPDLMSKDENRSVSMVSDFKKFRDKLINIFELEILA